jgi:hypothetical protein
VQNGRFTEEGLTELRQRMPFADLDEFAANPEVKKFSNVFTVQMICNYVESKLAPVAG